MKTVIVGGVAGGMSAATRLRRLDESAEIVVFERSGYVSFANCGLPYYIGGVIEERDALLLQTPASLGARFGLDVRVGHEVLSIDRAAKTVRVRELASGTESDEAYDNLILSPGASPFVPDLPGISRALTLRNIEDTDAMSDALAAAEASGGPTSAVVLGAGFIGLEVAENLVHRGWDVTVVELADQVLAPLDPEMSALVQARLEANGVRVLLGQSATALGASDLTLTSGETLPATIVVAAIGVRPESQLAKDAGLAVSDRGGIIVDASQRTSDPSVFAVGDAVVKVDAVDDAPTANWLANPANRQGRLVADVIAGRAQAFPPVLNTAIVGVFGLQAAATGWSEKRARAAGRAIRVIHTHPADHAGYYPGAKGMSLKLVVDAATDAILGAQGVGESGVDKRIDVIATAMRGDLTASDLVDLELSYAPQFGSAKDPVNMLGMIAENLRDGLTETIQWHELEAEVARGVQLIDVRTPGEFARGAIPGAINIPVDDLRGRLDEVDADSIVHCQVGLRGYIAARLLAGHGKRARNLDGGYRTWARA
ncbi:FAD-dependent oxidoreductase [Propioniciclava tarda]|uniref:CoA-disulfide reductase n=1 Tax=Propioniciclava tarda TaxID=433330 RepID=A0A4Q9KP24_PROTD|nr:FAD-dependent oxidoreductase [Propioniciclava tarda]TBT96244.1 CoA-disulfide reductase [Propioniciclava tarda]